MPLYRQESKFKGLGKPIYRNNMAQWCMRFADTAKPLLHLMREVQNSGQYLQADGYSGYGKVCNENNLIRIGCWDHARRKFVEASKGANPQAKHKIRKGTVDKADVALSYCTGQSSFKSRLTDQDNYLRFK